MAWMTALYYGAMIVGAAAQASATRQASKSAASAADTQARMVQASNDALVAKEEKAVAKVEAAQATSEAQAKETVTKKKKAIARSRTIYTSPLGIGGEAEVVRKTLLGA